MQVIFQVARVKVIANLIQNNHPLNSNLKFHLKIRVNLYVPTNLLNKAKYLNLK